MFCSRSKPWLLVLVLVTMLQNSASGNTSAFASPDVQYLNGLLSRRLFTLAEAHCRRELAKTSLSSRRRAELHVDLSRTFAEKALQQASRDRNPLWQRAHQVIDDFSQANGSHPYLPLVRRQQALVHYAQAKLTLEEAQVVRNREPLIELARASLRQSITILTAIDKKIVAELIKRSRRALEDTAFTTDELRILQKDIRRRLAAALLQQGISYPPRSPDRVHALTQAYEQYSPLAAAEEPVDWDARVELIQVLRLLGDEATIKESIQLWQAAELPSKTRTRFKLELARLDSVMGRHAAALRRLQTSLPEGTEATAEWDFEYLLAILVAWGATDDTRQIEQLQKQAVRQVALLEHRHGPYWMRRAEAELGKYLTTTPKTGDIAVLTRAAESFYRSGKMAESIEAYDRAALQAKEHDDPAGAFDLAYSAAAIEHQQEHTPEALRRFRELALAYPANARAAEAHQLAVYHSAQLVNADDPATEKLYAKLLNEHLQHWSDATTAPEVAFWKGRYHQSKQQWKDAVDTFKAVPTEDPHFTRALAAIAFCVRQRLRDVEQQGKPIRALARQSAKYFEATIKDLPRASDNSYRAAASEAALQAARIRLYYAREDYSGVEQLLRKALKNSPHAADSWKTAARVLLVYAIAAQPNRQHEAKSTLQEIADSNPADLLTLMQGLDAAAGTSSARSRKELAELQLAVAEMLQPNRDKLPAESQSLLDRYRATALARAEQQDQAAKVYERLVKAHPNDGELRTAYAQLLLDGTTKASWTKSLVQWRAIEKHSKRGSARWFLAKFSQAHAYEKLGQIDKAAKIVKLTQVLHPNLGGPALKSRFLALLARCET